MTRDQAEYICYCAGYFEEDFLREVRAAPRSFEALCRDTGVGLRCTACVPALEALYLKELAGRGGKAVETVAQEKRRGFREALRRWLWQFSPAIPNNYRSICPVVRGGNVATYLAVNNATFAGIQASIRPVQVTTTLRDAGGRKIAQYEDEVKPGDGLLRPISDALASPAGSDIVCGSADVLLRTRGVGHQGSIRPHLRLVTPGATTWVHTVGPAGNEVFHVFTPGNAAVGNMVHLRNCSAEENAINVAAVPVDGNEAEAWRSRYVLPAYGAALCQLPQQWPESSLVRLSVHSQHAHRAYFMVRGGDAWSADHI